MTKDNKIKTKDKSFLYFRSPVYYARMAELVDALVSNTSGSNAVPVRSRLRVQKASIYRGFLHKRCTKSVLFNHFPNRINPQLTIVQAFH